MRRLLMAVVVIAAGLSIVMAQQTPGMSARPQGTYQTDTGRQSQTTSKAIPSVATVMTQIRQSQGVTTNAKVDANRVNPNQLEQLGEAVMEERLANHSLHAWMNEMMGGDGSASVIAMHRQFGWNYLKGGHGGMMPGNMSGFSQSGSSGIEAPRRPMTGGLFDMGWGENERYMVWPRIIGILLLVLTVLTIAALIRYIASPVHHHRNDYAQQVLQDKYARGEINRDEYERRRRELRV